MNPGNYPNMAGPGMGHQGEQQKNRGLIQQHVAQILQQQQIPPGWQSTVPPQQRLPIVLQLISSLRLIKPDMDITQHVQIAINYELKVFMGSPDQASYDHACRSKLTDIAQTRTRQAVNIQEQLRNPQPPPMNMMQPQIQMQGMPSSHNPPQFHFTANSNPQLQQPMQAAGIPMQPQFMHQQPQVMMSNPQVGMQHMPQGPHPQIPPNHSQTHLTVEDNQTIQRIAHSLAANTPRDQLETIRHNLENMQPDQRQFLVQQNIDPMTYFFRNHATRRFLEQKAKMTGQRATHDLNGPGSMGNPQPPRPPSQNSLPIQPHQAHPMQIPPSQMVEQSFGGNMDQILGQQQEALRSQEAGQVVVPASQQRGNVRNTPQQLPNTLLGGNQIMQNLNQGHPVAPQYWGNAQLLQGNMQPAQVQAPPPTTTFGNMSTPAQIQGLGGQVGRLPQQAPNLPNLNKGLKESPQTQNRWHQPRGAPLNQPADQAPLVGQQTTPQPGTSAEMDVNQQRQRLLHQLAGMPLDQRREFVMSMQKRPRAVPQAKVQATEPPTVQVPENQAEQPRLLQDAPSNPIASNGAHELALPQQPPSSAVPSPHQTQPQRPQQAGRQNAQVAHLANMLNEEQAQQMDQLEFPNTILNQTATLSQLPPNIKTWGHLKAWVSQKNTELPPGFLGKIRLLQGLHYQHLAKQNSQAQQNAQNSGLNAQGPTRSSAPTAPMVPARSNGPLVQVNPGPGVAQGPRITAAIPITQLTVQEIQACRARLPPHLVTMTDEQICQLIFRQRQAQQNISMQNGPDANKKTIYQAGMQPQQFSTSNNQPNPSVQPGTRLQHPQNTRPTGNAPKEQQAKQPTSNRNPTQTQNQGQPKGIKRSINDDVIEVANPNLPKQEPQAQPLQTTQALDRPKSNLQNKSTEPSSAGPTTKAPANADQAVHASHGAPGAQSQLSPQDARSRIQLETEQRKARLHQLVTETAQSMPARQAISVNPQVKAKMVQKLRDARGMVQRLDHALPIFFRIFGDEKNTKDLIRIRLLLVSQYGAEYTPLEQLTMTPEELDGCLEKLNKYYQSMAKVVQQKGSISAPGQAVNQQPPGGTATGVKSQLLPETAPSLSTANLKEHQKAMQVQRQASVQKNNAANGGNRPPAAPTSPQPPFHFGSPDGVKYANRTDELTQARLKIPPNKKRKSEQTPSTASTPAQPQRLNVSKSPQRAKAVAQPSIIERPTFKCHAPECTIQPNAFASQAELEKHISDIHEPKEPTIDDPLQWTLEQVRAGLGLGENGKPKPFHPEPMVEKQSSEAAKMKKSPSAQGHAPVKQESATPMTRVPTQTGPSPSSNLLKTPQASANMKTPASDAKSSQVAVKDAKTVESKTSTPASKKQAIMSPDPWATSLVSVATVNGAFSGLADLNNSGAWTMIQNIETPPSTLSSGLSEKTSPRVSDISENDAVKISLSSDPLDLFDWSTFEFDNTGYEGESDYEIVDSMEWENTELDGSLKKAGNEGAREGRVEDVGPSEEWLRTFAPETLSKKKL